MRFHFLLCRFVTALSMVGCLFLVQLPIRAQSSTGVITGRVSDSSGASLQGARIELQPGGATAVTNNAGEFTIRNVAVSQYLMSVQFVGFAPASVTVTAAADQSTRADVTLQVASASDAVLVSAERPHGEAEAINRERTAENILQVLPAEVITSLPNANVADALGRLPSVTLERDEGEGKYVQIRGTEPRYSNVTVDGVNVPSPENVRQVKLDIIPSDLVESVEINKTLLANMDGDAIGGSVNLRTKAAGEKPTISLYGLGGGTPIEGGRGLDQFGGTLGKRFGRDKRLGLLFGGTYDYNARGIDDVEPGPQSAQVGSGPLFASYGGEDLRAYRYERTRYGFSGTADYKFSETSNVYLRALYSHFNNFGNRWVYSPTINNYVSPTLAGDDGSISFNASVRRPVQVIGSLAGGGQKYFRSSWVTWEVSASRASTEDKGYSQANFGPTADASPLNNIRYGIDLSNPYRPRFPVLNGVNVYDPSQYFLQSLDSNTSYGPQLNLQVGASFAKYYQAGTHLGTFEFGAKIRNAHKFNEANDVLYGSANPSAVPQSNFLSSATNTDFYGGTYQYGPLVDYNKFRSFFRANPALFPVNVSGTRQRNDPQSYNLVERISAGYLQNTINFGRWRLYAGLRFEGTGENVRGNTVQIDAKGNFVSTSPVKSSSDYLDALPSVLLRYALTPESGLRLAYGRGIARPDFSELPPYFTLNDKRNSISTGNPNLKPTHANNYDLLYEHYLKPLGLFSAGLFYKTLSDPIYSVISNVASGTYAGYQQTQPLNGNSAWLYGFEAAYQQRLSFLPGVLKAGGISANYSFTDSRADKVPGRSDHPALQRQAPHSWNVSPTYDRGRVSLRVGLSYNAANIFQYQYRDGADLGKKGPNGDNYLYAHLEIDAQASIALSKGFSAVVYALNLNNEVFGFYNGSPIYPNQREYYKTSFSAGLRWNPTREGK